MAFGVGSLLLLLDPSTLLLVACALGTIWLGARLQPKQIDPEETNGVTMQVAVLLPIVGSLMLVVLFYFLDILYYLLVVVLTLSAVTSVGFVVYPAAQKLMRLYWPSKELVRIFGTDFPSPLLVAVPLAVTVVGTWLLTNMWQVSDVIALCIGVAALATVRLPNLKVSAVLLCLFFLYDVFWVFFSSQIFGQSVMVTVAKGVTKEPRPLPLLITVPRLLTDGKSVLGMGDIVVPGLFICFLWRVDQFLQEHAAARPQLLFPALHFSGTGGPSAATNDKSDGISDSYFLVGIMAYAAGLLFTWIVLALSEHGQPALLYLVPFLLGATLYQGWARHHLSLLWRGTDSIADDAESQPEGVMYLSGRTEAKDA
eukprot:TRINITY_DN17612_c0_g1_i1.p1 TRINITY_DN17612_c0_g1~~TRINITY_DN17612_c0_g1_i1.p1  ORF type:complete len:379 (+),score=80.58 TRINITY_DN17612_c0_g1_i1:32-1138(+)